MARDPKTSKEIESSKTIEGGHFEKTTNNLREILSNGEKINENIIHPLSHPTYENLIDKLIETNPGIKISDIKKEGIDLCVLRDIQRKQYFKDCFKNINDDKLNNILKQEIFNKIQNLIGTEPPYEGFAENCQISGNDSFTLFLNRIILYLEEQQNQPGGKDVSDIINNIKITIGDLKDRLSSKISDETPLSKLPPKLKNYFNAILSFGCGKEVEQAIKITENKGKQLETLFNNSFPAINTIIAEIDDYKFDENKLGDEYESKLQEIKSKYDANESENNQEKETERLKMIKEIRDLKWEYYIKYLYSKNEKIANVLEQLYNNNFDYSKLDSNTLQRYLDFITKKNIDKLNKLGLKTTIEENFCDFDEFIEFYKDLADPSKTTINLSNKTLGLDTPNSLVIPITKSIIKYKNDGKDGNNWLKDIDAFSGNPMPYDSLPFHYEIKKSDIAALDITDDDKIKLKNFLTRFKDEGNKYTIEGGDIGLLLYLLPTIKNRLPATKIDSDKQEEIEEIIKDSNNSSKENNEETLTPEQFKEKIEKLGACKFENGAEIWLPMGDSELPGGGYQWMKIKINNINFKKGTFKGTLFGGELKFNNNLEGKSKQFKMNQHFFDMLENIINKTSADKNSIYLLPDPTKTNFNSFKDSLKGKLGVKDFSFPPDGITWDKNNYKFLSNITDKDGKPLEVKYFGASSDEKSIYKIEYNNNKNSFTVSSAFNQDEKGKNGKKEKKRFSYKREMDWNNFLIFITQKGLRPKTEEEADNVIQKQDKEYKMVNGKKWRLHRVSINSIKNGFKDIFGALKKKLDDYNKQQTEEFKSIVEKPLLDFLSKLPLSASLKYAVGERQQELYNEQYNGAWPEIEKYLKALQSDEQFADTFSQVPAHVQTIYGKSYQDFITDLFKTEKETSSSDKRKAAALLLANIQKGGSPYRGLTNYQNKGLWVKTILGQEHHKIFMQDKEKCINDLQKAGKTKDQIQSALANGEINYIINNITGANGALPYFGSHEKRGIPEKEDTTNYIPNPSKILLSDKFAGELKNAYQGWFTSSSVDQTFDKISHNNFEQAQADFKRLLTSSRYPGAIGNLRGMFKLAKTKEQLAECDKCFLIYMLSGVLDILGDKGLRKQAYQWGTTMSFLPGMLAKNTGHPEQVAQLLDDFCDEKGYPKFSNSVKSFFKKSDLKNGEMKLKDLFTDLDKWWSVEKMKEFEEYSKVTFRSKDFSDKPILNDLQKETLNPGTENINNSLLDNPLIANRGGLFSNTNVVHNRMELDGRGNFSGKDEDEKNNKKLFWIDVVEDIKKIDPTNVNHLRLALTQFFNFFNMNSSSDKQEIYKWIKTASEWEKEIGNVKLYENDEHKKDSMGIIGQKEIDSIIRYTFKGHAMQNCFSSRLPDELNSVLDAFQQKFQEAFDNKMFENKNIISKIFDIPKPQDIQPYGLGSRKRYNRAVTGREYTSDDEGSGNPQKDEKARVKRNFTSGNFINKKIADIERWLQNKFPESQYKSYMTVPIDDLMSRFSNAA